jgi:hypothetical protein
LSRRNDDFRGFETRISKKVDQNGVAIAEEARARERGDDEIRAAIKEAQTAACMFQPPVLCGCF